MFFRRVEDRIRKICARIVEAKKSEIPELLMHYRVLLEEHSEHVRGFARLKMSTNHPERRSQI